MIGHIRGNILEKQPPILIVDVQGLGYEVNAPMSTFYALPDVGKEVQLFAHLIIREDAHQLYGFYTREERTLFKALLKANGVGPRLALTILSSVAPAEFVDCVTQHDTERLVRLPGIGKKTAERLVVEMRDRLSDWYQHEAITGERLLPEGRECLGHHAFQDAISALIALGYKPQEASRAVKKIEDANLGSEELIRRALQEMR